MRIGIDVRAAQLGSASRGIGRYVHDLVEGLVRFAPGPEYVLLTLPDAPLPQRFLDLGRRATIVQVPTQRLDFIDRVDERVRNNPAKFPPIWRIVCCRNQRINARAVRAAVVREKLSLLHFTHGFDDTFFIEGRYPCPVVITCHDAIPFVLHEEYLDVWPLQMKYMYLKQAPYYARADRIAAVSRSAADDAVKFFGVSPNRITVVYNAVTDSFVRAVTTVDQGESALARYGVENPFFLFCGAGGPNKNRVRLVEAFVKVAHHKGSACPRPQLVFAGAYGDDMARIRQIVDDAALPEDSVRMLGFIPDNDLVALFTSAVAVMMPTLYEGFGLPAAEAMQIGTPVIGSDRGGLPEVIGDGGLLVDPYSVDAIQGAMQRLLNDPQLRSDLIARGYEHVQQFTLQRQATAQFEIYRETIAASRTGRRP